MRTARVRVTYSDGTEVTAEYKVPEHAVNESLSDILDHGLRAATPLLPDAWQYGGVLEVRAELDPVG